MEKHIITALLVLILLAPQSGLEAKGRHHGVKERDHDSEKHYYKSSKHRYSRHRGSHKYYRFARATKAELELLKQAIADINAKMDALEPQGDLPAVLAAKLDALQMAVDANSSAIGANSSDISLAMSDIVRIFMDIEKIADNAGEIDGLKVAVADLSTRIDALELRVDDHESRISALENPNIPFSGASFSGDFIGGEAPSGDGGVIAAAWTEFTGTAIGMSTPFSSIEIRSSSDGGATINASAFCRDPTKATDIAAALSSSSDFSTVCGGRTWSVMNCPGIGFELHAGLVASATACVCSPDAIVIRPFRGDEFWGGAGLTPASFGPTCGEPNQTLEVFLTN